MQTELFVDMIGVQRQEVVISELDDIDTLVRTYRARLLRFVTFSVGDADVAASIVQDCFLKAHNSREQFRYECSISTWLTTIAVNLVRDHQRVQKFQFWRKVGKTAVDVMDVASFLPSSERSPEVQLISRERAKAVAAALETLSERQRTVFLLRFSEEMELPEIARATGMPINTVRTHMHRALKAVRARVGGNAHG